MGSPLEPLEFQEIYFMINKRIYDKTCQTWPPQSWRRPTVRKLLGIFNPKTPEKQILISKIKFTFVSYQRRVGYFSLQ